MTRDELHADLEAMEWAMELERSAARASIVEAHRPYALDAALSDAERRELVLGVPTLADAPTAAPGRGLVSVPTTQTRRSQGRIPFRVRADAQALQAALGAVALDPEAAAQRRLSRLRMQVGVSARGHCVTQAEDTECLMVTLTYAGTNDAWQPGHIRAFMDTLRKWHARRDLRCRYVWVAELQRRGVIHYHVALWVPAGTRLPKPDEAGWWPHGMTRIEVARAAVPYLLKYLSKGTGDTLGRFPRGARIYGVGGLDAAMRRARRWLSLPAFVQGNSAVTDDWRRAKGGGWTALDGTAWRSEFAMAHVAGSRCLMRICTHPRVIEAHGPFNWIDRRPPPLAAPH